MRMWQGLALAAGIMLSGCGTPGTEQAGTNDPTPGQPAPPATESLLPRGTELDVVLNDTLSAEDSKVGHRFTATVRTPILTQFGRTVVPEGAIITGLVTGVDDSDHAGDEAYIRLNFVRLTIAAANHPFAAEILATSLSAQAGATVKDAEKSAATGAVAGAVIGAVIGGDLRAALEGAALGAGAGSVISLGRSQATAVLPAGTAFRIRTTANISLEH